MSIQINRFEAITLQKVPKDLTIMNKTATLIKDHKDDNICSFVQLFNDKNKNNELAERIISTIEDFIEENNAENQH